MILPGGKSIALAGLNANDLKEWTEKIKEASKPAPPSKNIEQSKNRNFFPKVKQFK